MEPKYLKLIEDILEYYRDPAEVLESDYDPGVSDYRERRKLLRQAKGIINNSKKDLDNIFELISKLPKYRTNIKYTFKTSFNTQGIQDLIKDYGNIAYIVRELEKTNTRLRSNIVYTSTYEEFIEICKVNTFDLMLEDLDNLLKLSKVRYEEYEEKHPDYSQVLDFDTSTYIESFKEGNNSSALE